MSLYTITEQLKSLTEAFDTFGYASDEAAAAIAEHTSALIESFDAKVDDYAALIRSCETRAAGRAEESARMKKLAQDDESLATRLRLAVMTAMRETGQPKIQTARFSLSVVKNGGATPIIISDEAELPEQFRVPTVTITIDKAAIRSALEAGESVSGAALGERGTRLSLK